MYEDSRNSDEVAEIWAAVPQIRADRRKDRVETTPEQLAAATAEAEISLTSTRFISIFVFYRTTALFILTSR